MFDFSEVERSYQVYFLLFPDVIHFFGIKILISQNKLQEMC